MFSDERKARDFIAGISSLEELFKEVFQTERDTWNIRNGEQQKW